MTRRTIDKLRSAREHVELRRGDRSPDERVHSSDRAVGPELPSTTHLRGEFLTALATADPETYREGRELVKFVADALDAGMDLQEPFVYGVDVPENEVGLVIVTDDQ